MLVLFLVCLMQQASTEPGIDLLQRIPSSFARRAELEQAIRAREYERAEVMLVDEIERTPSHELLTFLGAVFFLDGKYLNCAVALKKAEAIAPIDERSRFTLAMAYVTLDRREWARPELEKLVQTSPRNPLYIYWLGRLDYDASQYRPAIEKFRNVLSLDAGYVKAYDNLGLCYEALGDFPQAISSYRQAVELNRARKPPSVWPPLNAGALLMKHGDLGEAEKLLREAVAADGNFAQARYQLGVLLEKQGKKREALEELRRASELDTAYAEPLYALARIYRRMGDRENAEKALARFQQVRKEK